MRLSIRVLDETYGCSKHENPKDFKIVHLDFAICKYQLVNLKFNGHPKD